MAAGEGGTVPDKSTRTSVSIIVRTDNFSNLKAFMLEPNSLKKDVAELKTVRSETDGRICLSYCITAQSLVKNIVKNCRAGGDNNTSCMI